MIENIGEEKNDQRPSMTADTETRKIGTLWWI